MKHRAVIHIYARRLVAGLLIVALFIPGTIDAQGTAGSGLWRAPLSIWWAPWCGRCKVMWTDIKANPDFHAEFHQRFDVKWVNADEPLNKVQAPIVGVRGLPTTLGPGIRIEGYTSLEDLAARLGMRWRPRPIVHIETQPPPVQQPAQAAPPSVPAAALDGMQERINNLKSEGDDRWKTASESLEEIREWIKNDKAGEHLGKINQAVETLQGDLEAVKRAQIASGAPKFIPSTATPPIVGEPAPSRRGGLLGTIGAIGGLLGLPTWLVAIGGATGIGTPVIAGGWGVLQAVRWFRRRRGSKQATTDPSILAELRASIARLQNQGQPQDDPELEKLREQLAAAERRLAAQPGVKTRTEYVPVNVVDEEAESLREAMRREAAVNQDVALAMQRIESVAAELQHGKRTSQRMQSVAS